MIAVLKANPIWLMIGFLIIFGSLTYPLTLDMKCHGNVDYWGREIKVFVLPNGSTPDCLHPQGIGKIIAFYTGQDRYSAYDLLTKNSRKFKYYPAPDDPGYRVCVENAG